MAVAFLDLLWPLFLLTGIERVEIDPGNTVVTPLAFVHYSYSHSLAMTFVWATIFSGLYHWKRRDRTGALWLWIAVASHWVLDAIVHRPDLPLYPGGSTLIGLGLWNSRIGTLLVECSLFAAGTALYLRGTVSKDKTGTLAFWSLAGVLIASYFMNIFSTTPPPSPDFIAWFSPAAWLFVGMAYWADAHRTEKH